MKAFSYIIVVFILAVFTACAGESALTSSIDFSSPYVIKDDPGNPVQHRCYELYEKYGVAIFFNDTIDKHLVRNDYYGNPVYRYETLDMNWNFTSHTAGDVTYKYDYLTKPEDQQKALDYIEAYLSLVSKSMRPFCIFATDTVTIKNSKTTEKPEYTLNFRTLVLAQMRDIKPEDVTERSKSMIYDMVYSRVKADSKTVARFGEISGTPGYYSKKWKEELGCKSTYIGNRFMAPGKLFNESDIQIAMQYLNLTRDQFEQARADVLKDIGQFGFISGSRWSDIVWSPETQDDDLKNFVDAMLEVGSKEFLTRYGMSPLVVEKYDVLYDYIANTLGVEF